MKLWRNFYQNKFRILKPTLIVKKSVYDFIIKTTKESPDVETGGILMGHDKEPLTVHVTHASLPGPNAFHSATKFVRDTEYCSKILLENYNNFGVDYVGEWHSHIVPLHGMSTGDYLTVGSIMNDPDYKFNAFAVIVAVLKKDEVNLIGYVSSNRYIQNVGITIEDD